MYIGPRKPWAMDRVPQSLLPSRSVAMAESPFSAQIEPNHIMSPMAAAQLGAPWSASQHPPPLPGAGAHHAGWPALLTVSS